MSRSRAGFTLIELLVVTVMLGIISLALYSTFSAGATIWKRTQALVIEEDVNLFLEHFAQDVSTTFLFTGIDFIGKKDRLEFPILLQSRDLQKRTVGKVVYVFNPEAMTVGRAQLDYSALFRTEEPVFARALPRVIQCVFSFYMIDPQTKETYWADDFSAEKGMSLPLAIRIELEVHHGESVQRFVRTVSIPVSQTDD
ncbi:MAG TPA: type II secretion system protein [Candidatus Omnitrophota bacterium]|nr:type II secretion system protein [Candidatus Omnitrophota bacterium]HRZ14470.1 type II secretion system protein [Candidatus Omnitrophota bacterium]